MAATTPDPSTLTSSADIFAGGHTLPQIRAIHKSIHVSVEDKARRLRTQVGSSYRELLGTADAIVQMRADNERIQELLGGIGSRCGRAVVESKATGLAGFARGDGKDGVREAARVRLLDACSLVVGRLLRAGGGVSEGVTRGERLVLAAKVLVLSRLLLKSLGDELSDPDLGRDVEAAKKSLGTLRRRLLRHVEKALAAVTEDGDREHVVTALCAYSLATSSGARDVLRHFMHVRGEAMALALEADHDDRARRTEDVTLSLRLYTRSLLDVQAIVPARLSQAMTLLKSRPLLADPALRQLHGLRLDVFERWCGDEIQHFTPFIRHDDLDGKLAREMLAGWAKRGGEILLEGLGKTLAQMTEFKSIMDLRNSALQMWIRDGGRARGLDPTEMQDELREVINARMLAVLQSKVDKLHLVGSEMEATLEAWTEGTTDRNRRLWDDDSYEEALSQGAAPFVEEVVTRLYGRNDAVSKASHCYRSWFQVIDDVEGVISSLTKQRWDNDFDEVEDEETIEARQQALSRDDPEMLQAKLDEALDKSFEDLEEQVRSLWDKHSHGPRGSAVAMYLVRVLRDMRAQLPERPSTAGFGLAMVPDLHRTIAEAVSRDPLQEFAGTGLGDRALVGRMLWEGDPPLPTQPSPGVFGLLRGMSAAMGGAGVDLWTPAAVNVMKQTLDGELAASWGDALAKLESEAANEAPGDGDDEVDGRKEKDAEPLGKASGDPKTRARDLRVQWVFDTTYLGCCLGEGREGMRGVAEALRQGAELDEGSRERIAASAEVFWRRTSLLFGLLA